MTIPDHLIDQARAVSIESEIGRRGIKLKRVGHEFVGPCPRCGEGRNRFSIHIRKQLFNCRWCQRGGGIIDLVMFLDGHDDFRRAVELLTGDTVRNQVAEVKQQHTDPDDHEQHRKASWLWSQRRPIIRSIAEKYLREVRHISCALPPTLAFLPPTKPGHHPALISAYAAPVELESGALGEPRNVAAVHLTLLRADGSGKADVDPNKISIGSPLGLPIVLAPINDLLGLSITEGIEDGLTIYGALGMDVWAAGSASYLAALADAVPDYVTAVSIFEDGDDVGRKRSRDLAQRIRARKPRKGKRPGDLAERPIEVVLRRLT
jgi:hypothetical protein